MSLGQESTDFEWLDPQEHIFAQQNGDSAATPAASSDFLKEGYLHVMEQLPPRTDEDTPLARMAMKLVRRASDQSILGSWNKRWCVLSRTSQGIHLLLYKDHSSFSNLHSPCGVLALESCLKLSSLPTHNKSENSFTISLAKRDFLFYTNKSSDFREWMQVLQDGLNKQDAYFHSPLKGLPRQKALRKDGASTSVEMETRPLRTSSSNDHTVSAAVLEGVLATSEASSSQLLSEGVTDHVTVRRTMSVGRKHPPQATELEPIIRVIKFKKLNT